MRSQLAQQKNYLLIPLLAGMFYFVSCNSAKVQEKLPEKITEVVNEVLEPSKEAQRHFLYAWLADCVNDLQVNSALDSVVLIDSAKSRIRRALRDKSITAVFGKSMQLVWGPELIVRPDAQSKYTSANLLYCVSYKKDASVPTEYAVGIAGTNMILPFDWFSEDFDVTQQENAPSGGLISAGSARGFRILNTLKSNVNGRMETLAQYLNAQVTAHRSATISVSGHSLGGALTQVYSGYLKRILPATGIQAWVYAGPTAGDFQFASNLSSIVDYHSYNNTYDIIPHAWQMDKLNELCTIYSSNGIKLCDKPIGEAPVVNGIVTYLKTVSESNGTRPNNYTVPGNPVVFTQQLPGFDHCTALHTFIDCQWYYNTCHWAIPEFYQLTNSITNKCNSGRTISFSEFEYFFRFFIEMGEQHTTAYLNYFLGAYPHMVGALNKYYVPGGTSVYNEFENGKEILITFLTQVDSTLNSKGITNCYCN